MAVVSGFGIDIAVIMSNVQKVEYIKIQFKEIYMVKKTLMFFVSLLFLASVCFGQIGTTGAINGTVSDPDGVALPGITVILKSPALVLPQLTTVTNASGVYRFLGLAPGTYEVSFMLEGMNTLVRKGIIVSAAQNTTLNVGMTLKSLEESIVVSGKAPTIDRQRTSGVASLDLEFLKAIPMANREFIDYFNLTPGVTSDTAHGSGEVDNAYLLDGVNMGDPATGMDYVGFGADIMEEIAVQTGGISAEYGSVRGAVVNVITKSGGNKVSGSAFFYYNHESLQSDNTKGTDLEDPDDTTKTGQKFKMEPGFTIGGPIIKDKLWFFGNLSMTTEETYEPGYPADPGKDDIPPDTKRYFPYVKFTFQPNPSNKFIFSYNYSTRIMNHRFAAWWNYEEVTATNKSPTHMYNLHWTKTFGSSFYANLKLAMIDYFMAIHAKQPGSEIWDISTNLNYGSTWRNEDNNKRDRYQVVVDATTFIDEFAGSHELKFGGELQVAKENWEVKTYDEPGLSPGMTWGYIGLIPDGPYSYGYNFNGGFNRIGEMWNASLFINDTWSITKNLTLNLGIRYDNSRIKWPTQSLDKNAVWNPQGGTIDQSLPEARTPQKWGDFTTRLGFIYDIFSDGTTLFKGSFSRYLQPNQTGYTNLAHPAGWFMWVTIIETATLNPVDWFTPIVIWAPGAQTGVGYGDYDMRAPYTDELTLGIEREMWEDWSLGVRYIKKWDKRNLQTVDASRVDIDTLMDTGELVWIDYEPKSTTDPFDGSTVTFYNDLNPGRTAEVYIVNPPGAERKYDGVELTLNKRYSHGWSINLSYVYSKSQGLIDTNRGSQSLGSGGLFVNPNAHINMYGDFWLSRPHMLKVTGLVKGPWGINFSGYFRMMSGRRWERNVRDTYIADGAFLNQTTPVTIYAEKRGSRHFPTITLLDLRVEKEFKIGNVRLAAFADLFNVFNVRMGTSNATNISGGPTEFGKFDEIVDPRVVRLGVKIEFN